MTEITPKSFSRTFDDELLIVEAWGENAVRIRSFVDMNFENRLDSLIGKPDALGTVIINQDENKTELIDGKTGVVLDHRDRLTFYNEKNEVLLKEFTRLRAIRHDDGSEDAGTIEITKGSNSTLKLKSREYHSSLQGGFQIITRFESESGKKIFGMGQYQQSYLDLRNTVLELAQRNSQVSIPFYASGLGYEFLWNNPGIGEVSFVKNMT